MATVKENLIAARALIADPANWGKGEYNPAPGCFCALGAVMKARGANPDDDAFVTDEDRALARALPNGWEKVASAVADFNDDDATSHGDVIALFDRAIAAQDEDRLQTRDQMLRGLTP